MTKNIRTNKWLRAVLAIVVLLGVLLCAFPALGTKAEDVNYQNVPEPTENSIIFSSKTEPNKYITIKNGGETQYQEGGKGDGGWQHDGDPGKEITLTVKVLNPHGDYSGNIVYHSKDGILRHSYLDPVIEEQMDGTKAGDNTEFKDSFYEAYYKEILEVDPNAQVIVYCEKEAEVLSGSFADLLKNGNLNLDTKNLKTVTFKSSKQTPTKMALVLGRNYSERIFLKNSVAFFTPGTYELGLNIRSEYPDSGSTYEQDNEYWYFDKPITINDDTTLTLDFENETQKYTVNFDKTYDSLRQFSVAIYNDRNGMRVDEQVLSGEDYPSGASLDAYKNGYPTYTAYLKQDDIIFYFERDFRDEKKNVNSINIGHNITSRLSYDPTVKFTNDFKPGTEFNFYTDQDTDEYGNYCGGGNLESNKSWESKTEGYIVFTEKDTGKVIYQTLSHNDYGRLTTKLPTEEGNYSIEVKYFTKAKMPANPVTPEKPGTIEGTPIKLNGLVQGPDGKWAVYKDDKVDTTATGIYQNVNGWWRVENGYVNFKANGIYQNEYGWWKTTDGKVTFKETGVFQNENGWWRVKDSKVDFKANGIYQNKNGWWKTTNGKVTFKETGVFQNENGWWRVKDSKVDFKANGIYQNQYGWWKTTNGKVTFKENGVFQNEHGWWVVKDSKVDFNANGFYKKGNEIWKFTDGKITFKENGTFAGNDGKTVYRVKDSKVDTKDTGVYPFGNDMLKFTNGVCNYNENGIFKNNSGIWYLKDSKVDTDFTGFASNNDGTWYFESGKVNTKKTGTFLIEGDHFTLKNGELV